jgi:hypothetical protein
LRTPEHEHHREPHREDTVDPPLQEEGYERHRKRDPDQPAEQAVTPFPPIDRLERRDSHAAIEQIVLRGALVSGELRLPLAIRKRRNCPGDRPPFGDG